MVDDLPFAALRFTTPPRFFHWDRDFHWSPPPLPEIMMPPSPEPPVPLPLDVAVLLPPAPVVVVLTPPVPPVPVVNVVGGPFVAEQPSTRAAPDPRAATMKRAA